MPRINEATYVNLASGSTIASPAPRVKIPPKKEAWSGSRDRHWNFKPTAIFLEWMRLRRYLNLASGSTTASPTPRVKIPPPRVVSVGQSVIQPVTVVRDLGVLIGGELSMRQHVIRLAQTCFFHLRRLRSMRRQLGRDVMARLVSALVLSRLDYCNAVLPASTLAPLQRVVHATARVVNDLRPRDHVSSALRELLWLPIKQRIEFKLCLLVHKSLIGHSPAYISDLLTSAADVHGRPALRTASRGDFIVPRTNRKFGDRAFCVAAPRVWNRLPADLRQLRSTQTFRRHLKTCLFAASY